MRRKMNLEINLLEVIKERVNERVFEVPLKKKINDSNN
jgi:hypothetical protein